MNILTVQRDDSDELRKSVVRDHYLHRWPTPVSLPFGYVLSVDGERHARDGRLNGFIVFKKPQHHRQRDLFGYEGLPTAWQVLDMARVWINPRWQDEDADHDERAWSFDRKGYYIQRKRNFFSQFVGLCLRRVQRDWLDFHPPRYPDLPYHIRLIISYCELDHHDGTAYRACSFTSLGKTVDGSKEVYVKRLRQPQRSWSRPAGQGEQPTLFGMEK